MKNLRLVLKKKYNLAVGEFSFKELKRIIVKISKTKIKVSGRSCETGRKKVIEVPICKFWE